MTPNWSGVFESVDLRRDEVEMTRQRARDEVQQRVVVREKIIPSTEMSSSRNGKNDSSE